MFKSWSSFLQSATMTKLVQCIPHIDSTRLYFLLFNLPGKRPIQDRKCFPYIDYLERKWVKSNFIFKQNNCTFRLFPISRTSENWMYLVRTVAAALLFGGKTRNVLHWKWRVWIWNNEMWGQKPPSLSDSQKCVFTSISSGAQVDVSFPNCNKLPANRKMCTFPGNKKKSDISTSLHWDVLKNKCIHVMKMFQNRQNVPWKIVV
jgi:hypothetical protein